MNISNKTIFIEPYSRDSRKLNEHFRTIQGDGANSLKAYGIQFDTAQQIDHSFLLNIVSLSNLFTFSIPNFQKTKEILKKELRERSQIKIETDKSNIKFTHRDKAWLYTPGSDKRLVETSTDTYLNRVFKSKVKFFPGLCRLQVGGDTFFTKEPVQHFDSNQWAFVTGGSKWIQVFSNGNHDYFRVSPLKMKFGPGGLYIINDKRQIQNLYYQKYSQLRYHLTKPIRNSQVTGSMFELVGCGNCMLVVETDANSYIVIRSISTNIQGYVDYKVNYIGYDVLGFGAFAENDMVLVVYFISSFRGDILYDQYKFAIKSR